MKCLFSKNIMYNSTKAPFTEIQLKKTIMTSYQNHININEYEVYGKILTGFTTTIDVKNMELIIHSKNPYEPNNSLYRVPFRGWVHKDDSTKNFSKDLIEFLNQKISFSQTYLFYLSELLYKLNMEFC